ncbi:PDZ domain-containing protein [Paenibacillus doosanensis]|uniref:endopeptidase La n=1 Tax=Paenibacillus konkukensis TaxID=2020716 RepID=A0ABY4S1K5_9BACL|nr:MULTISPECIES: PDZ domain-containing protein [Paenibacillus]MCS7459491.1 PDZ domain-containing protein [Paenibacillus doosanensis]UQZ87292.1 Lon protease [Paenibacillus konkukensis]
MEDRRHIQRASRIVVSVFIAIALVYAVYFLPLPLFIFSAGTAEILQPMVHAKQNYEERGSFMLTTVRVSDATVFSYLLSFVRPYEELHRKTELLQKDETEQEYTQRQEVNMLSSQSSAIQAAYHKLNIPYKISNDGVVIMQVFKEFPAFKVLQPGDFIVKVDDTPVEKTEDLQKLLKSKQAGDSAAITYKRKKVTKTDSIQLAVLPADEGSSQDKSAERRVGLGVVPANMQSVKAEDETKQVKIKAGDIGGPSAGLMFTLEIINKLTPEDITKGYKIAGTGTIDEKGVVGVIGGIQHKVIAADKAGADIFFAPKDYVASSGQRINNYTDAVQRGEDIHTKMKIVPVGTLDDALQYLSGLPDKENAAKG